MTDRSARITEAQAEVEDDKWELPYLSKSRIKQYLNNPEHFRLKYVQGIRESETKAMRRGTDIHETFEYFHNQERVVGREVFDNVGANLPFPRDSWSDYITPYISNFVGFEYDRYKRAPDEWKPVSVEEELWDEAGFVEHGNEPPWMGLADAVVPAASLPIPEGEGVMVVDYKTGSVPDEKYRDEGIFTELEYYVMLFEQEYDVVGAAAYYPRSDTLLVQEDSDEYRASILKAARDLLSDMDEQKDHFETNPGPLCCYGEEPDERSAYYGICNCSWAVPVDNKDLFTDLVKRGKQDKEIAEQMGTTADAVGYWRYKFDLR